MLEKFGTIRNPLTIIAIFAGIAEISGTAVLPFITDANQSTYVWFLMVFPVLLVILFFLTLNFNHKVLYAPSDFKDEDNFFKSFTSASPAERAEKLKEEVREIENEANLDTKELGETQLERLNFPPIHPSQGDIPARYLFAEELVINKLSMELGVPLERNVRLIIEDSPFVFDAIAFGDNNVTLIEIKYVMDIRSIMPRFKFMIRPILRVAKKLPDLFHRRFSLIIAIATDSFTNDHERFKKWLNSSIGVTPFPVEVRVFSLEELKKEFDLDKKA